MFSLGLSGHPDLLGSAEEGEEGNDRVREGVGFSPVLLHGHDTQARATGFLLAAPDHPGHWAYCLPKGREGLQEAAVKVDLKGVHF